MEFLIKLTGYRPLLCLQDRVFQLGSSTANGYVSEDFLRRKYLQQTTLGLRQVYCQLECGSILHSLAEPTKREIQK